jgi:hypothetical protein
LAVPDGTFLEQPIYPSIHRRRSHCVDFSDEGGSYTAIRQPCFFFGRAQMNLTWGVELIEVESGYGYSSGRWISPAAAGAGGCGGYGLGDEAGFIVIRRLC